MMAHVLSNMVIRQFTGGAFVALLITAVSAIVTFGAQIVLARIMPLADFGHYNLAVSWLHILVTIGCLGMSGPMIKFGAGYFAQQDWSAFKGVSRYVLGLGTLGAIIVAAIMACGLWVLRAELGAPLLYTFAALIALIPMRSIVLLQVAQIRATKAMALSLLPENVLRVMIFLGLCVVIDGYLAHGLTAFMAVLASLAAHGIVSLIYTLITQHIFPPNFSIHEPSYKNTKLWAGMAAPFAMTALMNILMRKTDMVVAGFYLDPDILAIYAAVLNIAGILLMGYAALNMIFAPMAAALFANKDMKGLGKLFQTGRGLMLLGFGAGAALLWGFGDVILGLFGSTFIAGYDALLIFAALIFISSLAGPAMFLASMCDLHKQAMAISGLAAALNIALCFAFIPPYGIEGAAMASGLSWLVMQVSMLILCKKRLGIW